MISWILMDSGDLKAPMLKQPKERPAALINIFARIWAVHGFSKICMDSWDFHRFGLSQGIGVKAL